ncbi:hypothetical protein WJU23_23130 [Prosthecobacter sp. SYSU 5D2]|uniref:hypothetical protein n=1 Tax=Prosthecobacter sp. SYSU 5D2 TaxID=3134134 RepID=UPI0031FF0D81
MSDPQWQSLKQWLLGGILPAALFLYAGSALLTGESLLPLGRRGAFSARRAEVFTGMAGGFLALTYLAGAAWLHFHWVWGYSHRHWARAAGFKKAALYSGLVFLVAFLSVLITRQR